jgi:hypothetical protein
MMKEMGMNADDFLGAENDPDLAALERELAGGKCPLVCWCLLGDEDMDEEALLNQIMGKQT